MKQNCLVVPNESDPALYIFLGFYEGIMGIAVKHHLMLEKETESHDSAGQPVVNSQSELSSARTFRSPRSMVNAMGEYFDT